MATWKSIVLVVGLLGFGQPVAADTIITFDDLPGQESSIDNGYKGLDWSNFNYLDATRFDSNPSGYLAGLTSGRKVAYSGFTSIDTQSISAPAPFQLFSFQMTAAWYDGIRVVVQGNLNGTEVFSRTLNPSAIAPTLYGFDGATIDSLVFISDFGAGTQHPGYAGCCYQFAIDDLTVGGVASAVPEPGTWAMLAFGFGAAGSLLRARHRKPAVTAG